MGIAGVREGLQCSVSADAWLGRRLPVCACVDAGLEPCVVLHGVAAAVVQWGGMPAGPGQARSPLQPGECLRSTAVSSLPCTALCTAWQAGGSQSNAGHTSGRLRQVQCSCAGMGDLTGSMQ